MVYTNIVHNTDTASLGHTSNPLLFLIKRMIFSLILLEDNGATWNQLPRRGIEPFAPIVFTKNIVVTLCHFVVLFLQEAYLAWLRQSQQHYLFLQLVQVVV